MVAIWQGLYHRFTLFDHQSLFYKTRYVRDLTVFGKSTFPPPQNQLDGLIVLRTIYASLSIPITLGDRQ